GEESEIRNTSDDGGGRVSGILISSRRVTIRIALFVECFWASAMPYTFSKDKPRNPESLSSEEWRFLRAINVFGFLIGLVPICGVVFSRIQKNEPYLMSFLFGVVWVVFFAKNIMRATSWMRSAKRKESHRQTDQ
ncbi:MAG: hypothetical protein WCJ09_28175, partial [Planctomycetota bacterium]